MRSDCRHREEYGRTTGSGLTLLEVMVAMIVTSIVLLAAMYASRSGWITTTKSMRKNDAAMQIGENVEMMRYRIAKNPAANFPPNDSAAAPQNGITVEWDVQSTGPVTNTRNVTFLAHWKNYARAETLKVYTVIARNY